MTQQPIPATAIENLKRLFDAGLMDRATFEAAASALAAQSAASAGSAASAVSTVLTASGDSTISAVPTASAAPAASAVPTVPAAPPSGSGAVAQGAGTQAVGAGGVIAGGDNYGTINTGLLIQIAARPGASRDDLRRAYLARILRQADQLPLFAGDSANSQVRLSSVYTALLTSRGEERPQAAGSRSRAARRAAVPYSDAPAKRLSALDVLNVAERLVLLGGPGSGKSTFVNFVALSMAGELLGAPAGPNLATLTAPVPREANEADESRSGEAPEPQHWDHGPLLPVQVVLRDLASQLPPAGQAVDADAVWTFIRSRLRQAALDAYADHLHEELIQRGGLILLDGLDEVPDALDRREQVKQAVQDFAATFGKCRFLVTSRTYAYQRQDWKLDGFAEVQLRPFTLGQIHRFVDAWYAHMVELDRLTEAAARDRAEVLKREVGRNERIRELAERPLLLTLVAQLQTEGGGHLPEKREELYDRAVDMLLTRWETLKVRVLPDGRKEVEPSLAEYLNAGRDAIRKQLNCLAFEAHRDQPRLVGTADIRQARLTAGLLAASTNPDVKVRRLEEYLRDRAGILAAHGEGLYQFPHRSFQEYLAACHLTDDEFPDKLAKLVRADPNRWREVALLAGAKAARGSSLNAWALAETLCPKLPPQGTAISETDHWGALLAGRVLVECADLGRVAPRDEDKRDRVREWQRTIMRRNTLPAVERALAGRTLAVLGDPRPEVMTLDGMQFCLVPPGPFVMGSDRGTSDERPEHVVDLTYPYFMGRFPVTVAQWREYLDEAGRLPGEGDDERAGWSLRGRDNDPVVWVSWHDAVAFCKALTRRWRALLPAGFEVMLPSEAEWEKAARGGERIAPDYEWLGVRQAGERLAGATSVTGVARMLNPFPRRAYPWGEGFDAEKANVDESAIGETSAVGCHPMGFSPCGCEEMSGNVWEWTRSLWGTDWSKPAFGYPYRSDDQGRENPRAKDDVLRVVRGGAWRDPVLLARCVDRFWGDPGNGVSDVGFRAVLRSSPVR